MSTDTDLEIPLEPIGQPVDAPDRVVEVRRRAGLAVALGAGCLAGRDRLPGARRQPRGSARLGALRRARGHRGGQPRRPARRPHAAARRRRPGRATAAGALLGGAAVGRAPRGRAPSAARLVARRAARRTTPLRAARARGPRPARPPYRAAQPPAAPRAARRPAGPRHARPRRRPRPDHRAGSPGRRPDAGRGGSCEAVAGGRGAGPSAAPRATP